MRSYAPQMKWRPSVDRAVPTAITIAVVVIVFGLMLLSWRRRRARDQHLLAGYPAPEGAAEAARVAVAAVYYVATTPRDAPLERLSITGLGFRAKAVLTVTADGLWLALTGEDRVFIPGRAISALTPATLAIDRVVETDGLLRLGWTLHDSDRAVDSYFRIIDPADRRRLREAIRTIAATESEA